MILVICGLKAEAKIAAGEGNTVVCGGGEQGRLAADLARLAPAVAGLISFGVGGGLDPSLKSGSLVVGSRVFSPDGNAYSADVEWASRISLRLGVPTAAFAASDHVLADAAAKAELRTSTGAALVDMETHIVARAAEQAGKPFAALRAVTDPAGRNLPHAASVGMRADGSVDLTAILKSLAKQPGQLPGLIQTGLDARRAFAALLRGRQHLGPSFAFFDLD